MLGRGIEFLAHWWDCHFPGLLFGTCRWSDTMALGKLEASSLTAPGVYSS